MDWIHSSDNGTLEEGLGKPLVFNRLCNIRKWKKLENFDPRIERQASFDRDSRHLFPVDFNKRSPPLTDRSFLVFMSLMEQRQIQTIDVAMLDELLQTARMSSRRRAILRL